MRSTPASATLLSPPPPGHAVALCLGLVCAAGAAPAQPAGAELPVSGYALRSESQPRLAEAGAALQVDLVRWSLHAQGAWGLAVGTSLEPGLAMAPRPSVGLRWRSSPQEGLQRWDLAAWRHFGPAPEPGEAEWPSLSTRIELRFRSPRGISLGESGALGLQLSSDSRLSMRVRRGGPMVYYRMQF